MAPKYKGDGDSWLGDEKKQIRRGGQKKQQGFIPKNRALPWEQGNARVCEVFPNQCRIAPSLTALKKDTDSPHPSGLDLESTQKVDPPPMELLCTYRKVGLLGQSADRERSPVAVGDRVRFEKVGDRGVITGVCERKNSLVRRVPGKENALRPRVHVIASNIDSLVIVASATRPEFNLLIIDRFLAAAEAAKIAAVIVVTKMDLVESPPISMEPEAPKGSESTENSEAPQNTEGPGPLHSPPAWPWEIYRSCGYPVFEVSLKSKKGLDALTQHITNQDVVFCGHSGVGKTSLLTHFLGDRVGRVGEVSSQSGLGKHTTSSSVRYLIEPYSSEKGWTDTPGVREFALSHVLPKELSGLFPELRDISCEAPNCLHWKESGCGARGLKRYESYLKILLSILKHQS